MMSTVVLNLFTLLLISSAALFIIWIIKRVNDIIKEEKKEQELKLEKFSRIRRQVNKVKEAKKKSTS